LGLGFIPAGYPVHGLHLADPGRVSLSQEFKHCGGLAMALDRIFDVAILVVVVAIIIAIVTNKESAQVINAFGDAFANSIRAALGR